MSAALKIATVGSGYFSQFHYNGWKRMADAGEIEPVAICSLDRSSAKVFADNCGFASIHDDFETMLDEVDIDLVDIITPPQTHVDFVRSAVDRGIAVICQKPFTPGLEEAEKLVDYVAHKNGRVFVHENFRFQPWYPRLKSLVVEGSIGTPYQVSFWLRPGDGQGPGAYLERQPYFQKMPRFLVHETAIHLIDTFRFIFGEIASVYAQLDRLNPAIVGEDAGLILLEFRNGCRGVFDGNRLLDHPADNRRLTMGEMQIEGSDGTLKLDGFGAIRLRRFGTNDWKEIPFEWNSTGFAGDCVYLTNRHIVNYLRSGSPVMNTAAEYLTNLRIEEAVYQSAKTGRRIDL